MESVAGHDRRLGAEDWGEKFERAIRRARTEGCIANYMDLNRQLASLPLPVRSDASLLRLGRDHPRLPESEEMRLLALAAVVKMGYQPSQFGLSMLGREEFARSCLPDNMRSIGELRELPPETWGEQMHRAKQRAKKEGRHTGQADVAERVSRVRNCGTGTIPLFETYDTPPPTENGRALAWLMLKVYGYDPEQFGITPETTPMLRFLDEETVSDVLLQRNAWFMVHAGHGGLPDGND